jgi:hypothetical protein
MEGGFLRFNNRRVILLLDVEVTVGTVQFFVIQFVVDPASFIIDSVVEEEGDFFGLFVDGVMSLPSVVVVPDPDEVFLLDPVLEGRGGDLFLVVTGVLPLSATGVVPNAIDVDSADSSIINWSSGVIQNDFSVSMLLV